jgi:hypothetical protein
MDVTAKELGEFIAYGTAVSYAFFKIFQNVFSFLKGIFKKDKDKSGVTVNINSQNAPKEFEKDDYRYFLYFLLEQGKILRAMHDLKSDILKEQMDYLSRHVQDIKVNMTGLMMKHLYDLLDKEIISEIKYETYLMNFENFLEILEYQTTETFRKMCKDNHFSDYTQSEYRDVITRNVSIIEGEINELIRKRYPQRDLIREIQNLNQIKIMIRISLKDCLEHARDVSIEKSGKVNEAKKCFEKRIEEAIGIPYSLEL